MNKKQAREEALAIKRFQTLTSLSEDAYRSVKRACKAYLTQSEIQASGASFNPYEERAKRASGEVANALWEKAANYDRQAVERAEKKAASIVAGVSRRFPTLRFEEYSLWLKVYFGFAEVGIYIP